jgi:hypothetical protein
LLFLKTHKKQLLIYLIQRGDKSVLILVQLPRKRMARRKTIIGKGG